MKENTKSLKYFMRKKEEEIVTVPGPDSFRDEDGKVIDLEIKVLFQEDIEHINNNYRRRSMAVDKKGNPLVANHEVIWKTETNNAKASRHLVVEALQYPNLKDPELMEYYDCHDITEMPLKVFSRSDEYQYVLTAVLRALGIQESPENDSNNEVEEAKN